MEIIKHGITYRKIECCECGCVFRFTQGDVRDMGFGILIPCPECCIGNSINNSEQEVQE